MDVLVLQHIACEPPGVYEDVLRERSAPLPVGATLLASSLAYPNQAFRFRDAHGVRFHLEVSPTMAEEWSRVPEYGAYADRVLGPGALPGLLAEVGAHADEMRDHGRRMFETWLDTTVGARG